LRRAAKEGDYFYINWLAYFPENTATLTPHYNNFELVNLLKFEILKIFKLIIIYNINNFINFENSRINPSWKLPWL